MQHINPMLRQTGLRGILLANLMPEIYVANSIGDFLEDRNTIKLTGYPGSIGYSMLGGSGGIHLLGRAVINFLVVDYHQVNPNIVYLDDTINQLLLGVHDPYSHQKSAKEQGLENGDRVQMASALYDPRTPWLQLIAVRKILEIPHEDENSEMLSGLSPAFGFGY